METSSITVRKKDYQFSKDLERFWLVDSAFATHFANTLHVLFPPGENFFVKVINKVISQIPNEKIKQDAKNFSAQEMQHSLQHKKFLSVLRHQGYNFNLLENVASQTMGYIEKKWPQKLQVSMVAAFEHYTALFAKIALESDLLEHTDEEMKTLFEWHAAEEIEHKAVAFDVLKELDDNYILRAGGMVASTTILWGLMGLGLFTFLKKDKKLFDFATLFQAYQVFLGERQLGLRSVKAFWQYFVPNFHPNQIQDAHLAKAIFEKHEQRKKD